MLKSWEIDRMKEILRDAIGRGELAGGSLLLIQGGEELLYLEDGFADREEKRPIRRDSIFRMYSMTKPVTSAAVMILLERGVIDLFEPVSQFLPGFHGQKVDEGGGLVPVEREMNLKDLLSMTSGLTYGGPGRAGQGTEALLGELVGRLFGDHPMSTMEAMNRLGTCPLAFQPGSSWQYGTSADVLGAVVEAVSGMRFGDFLKKEIFDPLGMQDTAFWVAPEKRGRLATAYAADGKGGLVPYTDNNLGINNRMDRDPAFESGGAGLASTIDDYAKFACMLLSGGSLGGVTVLRPETVRYMTSASLGEEQQRAFERLVTLSGFSYSNLMRVMTDRGRAGGLSRPGEYGWDGWLGSYFCNCPEDDLTFFFMMQRTDAGTTPLVRKLRSVIFSAGCR